MGELRFTLTFFGGKAEDHRVPAHKLGGILRNLEDDIKNVCRVVSSDDKNVDLAEIISGCKLYVVGTPKESSLEIPIATIQSDTKWPEVAGQTYLSALKELPEANGELPRGINRSILEHIVDYTHDREYDGFHVTIQSNGEPETSATIDSKLGVVASQKLAELAPYGPSVIYGHSVTGVMYGLEDQNYDDPSSSVTVEVDSGDGKRWMCHIPKDKIPKDLGEHWKERVVVQGIATFRPRKPEMQVEDLRLLGPQSPIDEILDRFIRTNRPLWEGENIAAYMDRVRERD
jgi:hypothetical protein